jgi:hypothetical protein
VNKRRGKRIVPYLNKTLVGEGDIDAKHWDQCPIALLLVVFDGFAVFQDLGNSLDEWCKLDKLVSEPLCVSDLEEEIGLCLFRKAAPVNSMLSVSLGIKTRTSSYKMSPWILLRSRGEGAGIGCWDMLEIWKNDELPPTGTWKKAYRLESMQSNLLSRGHLYTLKRRFPSDRACACDSLLLIL